MHPRFAEAHEGATAPSLTVDEYVTSHRLHPRLVKVDVEGAELSVLHGMRGTLAEHRPVVVLEVHPKWLPDGIDAADVQAVISDAGYGGAIFDDGGDSRREIWRPRAAAEGRSLT